MIPALTDIKAMVRGTRVYFVRYHEDQLWYRVAYRDDPQSLCGADSPEKEFEFPVPIADIGGATFLAEDRAILFMRYMRKHLQALHEAQREQLP